MSLSEHSVIAFILSGRLCNVLISSVGDGQKRYDLKKISDIEFTVPKYTVNITYLLHKAENSTS